MERLKEHERYECLRQALDKLEPEDRDLIRSYVDNLTLHAKSKNTQLSDDGALLVLAAVGMILNGKSIRTIT